MESYKPTTVELTKELAKKVLKPFAIGRWVYPAIQRAYRAYAVPMKRRRLQKNGVAALHRLHKLLSENDVQYYCDAGTLLGFVRDKCFMPHDDDIDITKGSRKHICSGITTMIWRNNNDIRKRYAVFL